MSIEICMAIGGILAVIATVLLYVLVFPKKREGKLNKFLKRIKALFGNGYLLIEKINKFIYVLMTTGCIFVGFWMLFYFEETTHRTYSYGRSYDYYTTSEWLGWIGLILMIAGPIIVRLLYEGMNMFIILIKNVMDIRNKLLENGSDTKETSASPAPVSPAAAKTATEEYTEQ